MKTPSEMTYTMSGGALNSTQSNLCIKDYDDDDDDDDDNEHVCCQKITWCKYIKKVITSSLTVNKYCLSRNDILADSPV